MRSRPERYALYGILAVSVIASAVFVGVLVYLLAAL